MIYRKGFLIVFWGSSIGGVGGGVLVVLYYIFLFINMVFFLMDWSIMIVIYWLSGDSVN